MRSPAAASTESRLSSESMFKLESCVFYINPSNGTIGAFGDQCLATLKFYQQIRLFRRYKTVHYNLCFIQAPQGSENRGMEYRIFSELPVTGPCLCGAVI